MARAIVSDDRRFDEASAYRWLKFYDVVRISVRLIKFPLASRPRTAMAESPILNSVVRGFDAVTENGRSD